MNQLNGTIPSSIGNLSALLQLNLYDNNLYGTVPPSIGELTALQILNLSSNHLDCMGPGFPLNTLPCSTPNPDMEVKDCFQENDFNEIMYTCRVIQYNITLSSGTYIFVYPTIINGNLEINSGAIVVINSTLTVVGNLIVNNGSLSLAPSALSITGCANFSDASIIINKPTNDQLLSPIISVPSGCVSINASHTVVMGDPTCIPNFQYAHSTTIYVLFTESCQNGSPMIGNWVWIVLGVFGFIFLIVLVVAIGKIILIQKRRSKNLNRLDFDNFGRV